MKKLNKLSSTLSIAATVLLQACSTPETATTLPAEANTRAPELNASWKSVCIATSSGSTSTTTQASGGGGGTGGVSGGTGFITEAIFNANGSAVFSTEYFATSNCNTNTSIGAEQFKANFFIGNPSQANDGSPVTDIKYTTINSTTYSIFQVVNNVSLYLGSSDTSTSGNDGSSESNSLDGLGIELDKI